MNGRRVWPIQPGNNNNNNNYNHNNNNNGNDDEVGGRFHHEFVRTKEDRNIHVLTNSFESDKRANEADELESINEGNRRKNGDDEAEAEAEERSGEDDFRVGGEVGRSAPPTSDTLLFLIHGVGGSAKIWAKQLEFFSGAGYACAAVDMIGHGMSSVLKDTPDYEFEAIADDIIQVFCRYKKRRKKNVIVAHSYGCAFASLLAHTFQAPMITHLVLFAGGAPGPLLPDDAFTWLPRSFFFCCNPCITTTFHQVAFQNSRSSNRRKSSMARAKKQAFQVHPSVLNNIMRGQVWPGGTRFFHSNIRTPTLVVHGETDPFVSLEEDEEMFKVLPDAQLLVVKGAAHMAMMEKPDDVNQILLSFLTTCNTRSSKTIDD